MSNFERFITSGGQEMGVYRGPSPVLPAPKVDALEKYMSRNPGSTPVEAIAALKADGEASINAYEVAKMQREQQMQADLDKGYGRYYDKAPGTGGEIQISLGDVVDINKQGMPPVNPDRVINGKAYLPPPDIQNVNHLQTEYELNDAGRNAQAQLAGKLPMPQISPELIQRAMQQGGTVNPSTGSVSIRPPQANRGLSMSDPEVKGLSSVFENSLEMGEDPQTAYNDYQTSLSLLKQRPPQAQQAGGMPAPAQTQQAVQPSLTVKQYMQPGEQVIAEDRDAAEVQGADGRTYVIIKATGERIAV